MGCLLRVSTQDVYPKQHLLPVASRTSVCCQSRRAFHFAPRVPKLARSCLQTLPYQTSMPRTSYLCNFSLGLFAPNHSKHSFNNPAYRARTPSWLHKPSTYSRTSRITRKETSRRPTRTFLMPTATSSRVSFSQDQTPVSSCGILGLQSQRRCSMG
jgi:hypothetical protein